MNQSKLHSFINRFGPILHTLYGDLTSQCPEHDFTFEEFAFEVICEGNF